MNREEIEKCTVLRGLVGSTVYGINVADGTEDRDEMGVCIEPMSEVLSLDAPFQQFIYRSAVERTGDHNARSSAGDLDLTVYSLRKYLRLALKGNPTIIGLLFNPQPLVKTTVGQELIDLRRYIISKRAGSAFLGYMKAQRERMQGERGGRHGVRHKHRTEGYDTKYAMHLLRLGLEGIELMRDGWITLPMLDQHKDFLLSVRRGEVTEETVIDYAETYERELKHLLETTTCVRERPNALLVEEWMNQKYEKAWLKK